LSARQSAWIGSGRITFHEQCRLVLSRELSDYLPNEAVEWEFKRFEGRPMLLAEKFRPEAGFLEHHRGRVFRE
jgi:hypothetical protein